MENETGMPALPSEDELAQRQADFDDAIARAEERAGAPAGSPPASEGGFLANLKEIVPQMGRGLQEGANAATDGAYKLATWLNDNIVDLGHIQVGADAKGVGPDGWLTWAPGMGNVKPSQFAEEDMVAPEPKTIGGQIANDAAQLGVGLIGYGKLLKVGQAAGVLGKIGMGMLAGAAADATMFDGNDERLSNFIQSYPSLQNPVTEFLASNPDDNEALGRLKNAAEGLVLGGALEALLYSVRFARAKRSGNVEEAQKVLDEVDAAADAAKAAESQKTLDEANANAPEAPKADPDQLDMFGNMPEPKAPEAPAEAPKGETFEAGPDGQLDMGFKGDPENARTTTVENGPMPEVAPKDGSRPVGMKPVKKLIEVDDEGLKRLIAERDWQNGLFPDEANISGIRTDNIENGEDIKGLLDDLTRVYGEQIQKARGGDADGVRTFQVVKMNAGRIADTIGGDSQMIMQRMASQHKNLFMMDAELRAYGDFLATVGAKVYELSEFVANPMGPVPAKYASRADMMADFAKHYELMANAQAMYRGMQTNTARALNAFKIGAKVNTGMLEKMNPDELFAGGPQAMEKLAKQIKATGGNTKAIAMTTKPGFLKKAIGMGQEMWINGLLSGPKTHVVNTLSSTLSAAFAPSEKMLSGALRAGTKEGRADFVEGAAEYVGLVTSIKESIALSARAFKEGTAILDPMRDATEEIPNWITASNFGVDGDRAAGQFANAMGVFFRLPSRLLMAEDEFVKQMSYRSQIRARAIREHLLRDGATDTMSLADRIATKLDAAMDEGGKGLDEIAMDQARRVTFSNDLKAPTRFGGRTFGETLQTAANNHPAVRMILPFVRTPTNIARFVWQRTPGFNLLRKQDWDDAMGRNGPKAKADVIARTTIGGGLWAAAASMAYEGQITGGGPADTDMRRALEATGWKPYSYKKVDPDTGKVEYIQFNRADPFAMFFGLAADFAEAAGYVSQGELDEIALNMTSALARNLQNKTYMSGLTQAIEALANPERKMSSFGKGMAGSFVPYSAFFSQTVNTDPHMRDARSLVDAMRAKVPGLSEKVDPMRNVFGEKVLQSPAWGPDWLSPFSTGVDAHVAGTQPITKEWQTTVQSNPKDELSRLAYIADSVVRPTGTDLGGVDLLEFKHPNGVHSAADRYAELVGQVKISGLTLQEQLQKVITSPMYLRATDGDAMNDGSRIELVRRVFGAYREKAQDALFKENPEIRDAWRMKKYEAAVAKGAAKGPQAQPTASEQLPGLPPIQ